MGQAGGPGGGGCPLVCQGLERNPAGAAKGRKEGRREGAERQAARQAAFSSLVGCAPRRLPSPPRDKQRGISDDDVTPILRGSSSSRRAPAAASALGEAGKGRACLGAQTSQEFSLDTKGECKAVEGAATPPPPVSPPPPQANWAGTREGGRTTSTPAGDKGAPPPSAPSHATPTPGKARLLPSAPLTLAHDLAPAQVSVGHGEGEALRGEQAGGAAAAGRGLLRREGRG